jgi:hypothetical protein
MKLKLFITLIICITLSISFEVKAEDSFLEKHEVSIGFSFYTAHFSKYNSDGEQYNNKNDVILFSIDQWFATTFINSQYVRSYAFGYTFSSPKWKPFQNEVFARANLITGVVYGYEGKLPDFAGWSPCALPSIEIGYKRISIETAVMPTPGGMFVSAIKFTF